MESWGSWVNPELWDIVERRDQLESFHRKSKELQQQTLAYCKANPVAWIQDWVFTYDPRNLDYGKPAIVPFILFPKQIEYLQWRAERRAGLESGLVEKCRDMGVTWLNVAAQTHSLLFEPGYKGIFASRKEKLVDSIGNLDAIFPKIRFILQYLPGWMLPKIEDNYMRIYNPTNGAAITGEAGDNIGRGGRASVVDWDEVAFTPHQQAIDSALSQTTKTVFYTSTPNGAGDLFYQKRHSGKVNVFIFDWRDDARKDQAWYDEMVRVLDPIVVAQEIDRDYQASQQNSFIPAKWLLSAVGFPTKDSSGQTRAGLDVATEGSNRNVLTIVRGCTVFSIQDWQGMNTTETALYARRVLLENQCPHLNFDADGVGAGVSGALQSLQNPGITFTPLHGAASPSDLWWAGEQVNSKDKFANLRAEAWYLLRERFRKTYETVEKIATYPEDELISIPRNADLISQLSTPKMLMQVTGKIKVESKEDMRKRGMQSPDYADSLVYAFYPTSLGGRAFVRTPARWR